MQGSVSSDNVEKGGREMSDRYVEDLEARHEEEWLRFLNGRKVVSVTMTLGGVTLFDTSLPQPSFEDLQGRLWRGLHEQARIDKLLAARKK